MIASGSLRGAFANLSNNEKPPNIRLQGFYRLNGCLCVLFYHLTPMSINRRTFLLFEGSQTVKTRINIPLGRYLKHIRRSVRI